MKQLQQTPWYGRLGLGLMGLAILSLGLGALLRGRYFYQTFWGGAAFAPIVILVGALIIYLATTGWRRWLKTTGDGSKGQNRGR